MYEKSGEDYHSIIKCDAYIGENGATENKREGDLKTPIGIFSLGQAFGRKPDPGCTGSYLKVSEDDYWVDDPESIYYNRLVKKSDTEGKWSSAEHLIDCVGAYEYAVSINQNSSAIPGNGSAVFLHCDTARGTAGCVAIPEEKMAEVLKHLHEDTMIIITG